MKTRKPPHLAFRTNYSGVVRELRSNVTLSSKFLRGRKLYAFFAVWDTGATGSVISKKVVEDMGLSPTGKIQVKGVFGEEIVNTYFIDIGLPNKLTITDVKVSECKEFGENIDLLIGMNIIQMGDFAISNAKGKTTFSFCYPPHETPIDLLEKTERVNKRIMKKYKK